MRLLILILFILGYNVGNTQNQNLSNEIVFDGEPYIVVNPNNSQHIVVAWLGFKLGAKTVIKTRTSFDAGQTWSQKIDIPHFVSTYQSADPSLAFDNNGNVFLAYVDFSPTTQGSVFVTKSTDGGLTWGTPVEVINVNSDGAQKPIDRPWMAVDISGGINDGNIYVTTMTPGTFGPIPPPYNPYFIHSTDGGVSFEPWRHMDTTNWLAGNFIPLPMPTPCVGADGTFHAIYPSLVLTQNLMPQYILASSNSAGATFNYNSALNITQSDTNSLTKKGYTLTADPSDANHLLFVYPDISNGDLDVFMIESFDKGLNWTNPIRINDDPIANNRIQDLIWVDFDHDGDVIITWRDRRNANDSTYQVSSEIYGAVRWKDSTSFSSNFAITDTSVTYNTILANNGNDFMSVDMINDTAYVVWGDTRNGFLNIWFQQLDLRTGTTSVKDLENDIAFISVYPNPSKEKIAINLGKNELQNASLKLIDIAGNIVLKQKVMQQKVHLNLSAYSSGTYFVQFSNNKGSKTLKVVKE